MADLGGTARVSVSVDVVVVSVAYGAIDRRSNVGGDAAMDGA